MNSMDPLNGQTKSGAVYPYFEFDLVSAPETTRRVVSGIALAVGLWFWKVSLRQTPAWLFRLLGSSALVAGVTVFWKTKVVADGSSKVVCVQSRFLGQYVTWQRRFQFADFSAIVLYCDLEARIAEVYLRKLSGRDLTVRYGSSQGDAQWVARRLGEVLELPVQRQEF